MENMAVRVKELDEGLKGIEKESILYLIATNVIGIECISLGIELLDKPYSQHIGILLCLVYVIAVLILGKIAFPKPLKFFQGVAKRDKDLLHAYEHTRDKHLTISKMFLYGVVFWIGLIFSILMAMFVNNVL